MRSNYLATTLALALAVLAGFASPSEARGRHHAGATAGYGWGLGLGAGEYAPGRDRPAYGHPTRWGMATIGLSAECRKAAAQGGPCGCVAAENFGLPLLLKIGKRMVNLKLAREWAVFPRTSPGPGAAAIWPWHHVEKVIAGSPDGPVTTVGPYGVRHMTAGQAARLIFVQPTTRLASF